MTFSTIFLIQILVTILFSISAAIYDVKCNFVPDSLTFSLMIFGLMSNLFLSFISGNIKFILASFISMAVTNFTTYMLWRLKMWGGGDVKLFTAIATAIPFGLNINFLNIFPQLSVYPFAFSIVANSILVSFPFLLAFVMYLTIKNDTFKGHPSYMVSLFDIENLKNLIHSTLNRDIPVRDLHEGNILNNCYFNDEHIIDLINESDGNLEIYENHGDDEFGYYFKSMSAGGITERDTLLIKVMSAQGFIGDTVSVKVSYPFTPAILGGLLVAIFYGDIMMLFAKNMVLVI